MGTRGYLQKSKNKYLTTYFDCELKENTIHIIHKF